MRKKLAEVRLINVEQMSLYNFIILRKKETPTQVFSHEISETFKTVVVVSENITCYVIKNYVGHKLAIFNGVLLLYYMYC